MRLDEDGRILNLGTNHRGPQEVKSIDPFQKSAELLLEEGHFDQNFRRRSKRYIKKMQNEISGDGARSKQDVPITAYGILDVVNPPYNLHVLANTYEISPVNYAAINAKVNNVVGLGYRLAPSRAVIRKVEQLQSEEGSEDKLKKFRKKLNSAQGALEDWLESRNNEETFTAIMTRVMTDVEAMGNGFVEIGRKTTGEIGYIGHIPAQNMRVRRKRDGFVQLVSGYGVSQAIFFANFGDEKPVDPINGGVPNEIIHIKTYTPVSSYYGAPAVIPSQNAIVGNDLSSKYNLEYFEHKAVPRQILWLKGATMSPNAEQELFDFLAGLKGNHHRTAIIPIPGDTPENKVEVKMEAVEESIQDSSFTTYKKMNALEILAAHRVPPSKIGMQESGGLAAMREADRTFKEQVCRPLQKDISKKVNGIIQEMSDLFEFQFNELTLTDEDSQSKIDERYLRMKTLLPNEVRQRMNLPALPEGDKAVQLTSQQNAELNTRASGNRERDQQRAGGADNNETSRNEQGEGRQTQ